MIEAVGLSKSYGRTRAVDDLTFEVRPGLVTGFLGPNGSGKSTTMRMIMGLDRPDAGQVTVDGRRYHDLPWPLREVGALLEAKAVHPGRSAYHHLLSLAQSNAIPAHRVEQVLDQVGLTSVAGRRVGKFSLGMSQRLGIASALLGDPGVLLFDEPINGLDPEGILWVRKLLQVAGRRRTDHLRVQPSDERDGPDRHRSGGHRARHADRRHHRGTTSSTSNTEATVLVRSPEADRLADVLASIGAVGHPLADGGLLVTGPPPPRSATPPTGRGSPSTS